MNAVASQFDNAHVSAAAAARQSTEGQAMSIAQGWANTLSRDMHPPGLAATRRGLREMVSCKVCLRVAGAVFLLIMVVESLILIPSALRFRDQEWLRLAELARATVEVPLGVYGSGPMLGDRLPLALGHHKVLRIGALVGLMVLFVTAGPMVGGIRPCAPRTCPPDNWNSR